MTGIQSIQLAMMEEINSICKSEGLSYVLSHETAAYVKDNDGFIDEQYAFKIMMPMADIAKLKACVESKYADTRFIESWENNPDLLQLKFLYVDRSSTVIDGGSVEHRIAPGATITIFPARSFKPEPKALGCEHYVELVNKSDRKKAKKIVALKALSRINKEKYGKMIESRVSVNTDYIQKAFTSSTEKAAAAAVEGNFNPTDQPYLNSKKEKCFVYIDDKGKETELPANLFTKTTVKKFDGVELTLYAAEKDFLSAIFGKGWKKRARNPLTGTDRITVISDPEIPYADYLDYIKDDEVSFKEITVAKRENNTWMSSVHNPAVAHTQKNFMEIRRSVERIDIWYRLRSKRADLKKAYEEKDVAKLRSLLSEYLRATERYRKEKVGFYIDDEIFTYAKLVWEEDAKGSKSKLKKEYAKRIYELVPEIYKNETPDEYFAKRGTVIK